LVIKKGKPDGVFERIGFRVFTDEDLDKASSHFKRAGRAAEFVEVPYQGRTLQLHDDAGTPLEFCATMPVQKRLYTKVHLHRGAAAQRMDHWQILVPEPIAAAPFYTDLGFRISDYLVTKGTETIETIFMHRKNNPWDIVLAERDGPRLHHFGYVVQSMNDVIRACDVAGNLGWGARIESGPGRHADPHAYYLYMRDPAGHRVELLLAGIQLIDMDEEPNRCDIGPDNEVLWGRLHPDSWVNEGSLPLSGTPPAPRYQR
jgi:catechol 2,3-dioxygenase